MERENEDEKFVSMEIQIWNNKDSNGMFLYNNNLTEYKKVYFNFDKNEKDCFLIKTIDNYIQILKEHKNFKEGKGEILFRIRRGLKKMNYEVINPILEQKIFSNEYNYDYNYFLNDKIWFSVKSLSYFGGNRLNYNLNENDIIKFGKQKYIIGKIHFAFDNGKENIIDENFYQNNNISYVSIINKKSKSIFNIDIKPNRYKIRNNKNTNIEKLNGENINAVMEINIKESKNINQNSNGTSKDTNYNSLNIQNTINNLDNNISTNNALTSQNNGKNGKNNYQKSSAAISTNGYSSNAQKEIGNENESSDNESDGENENEKCWLCLNSNCDEDNPLICLCNCHNFIHYECLKMYLNSKIIVTINLKKTVTTYTFARFNCDICLKPYQLRFRIPELNKTYELINLNLPEEVDYICLESLNYIKNNNNIKIVHIVQLMDEKITIGRNNYNDILCNDISVSRDHAILKYNKNNKCLFLENTNGKYGTLVLVRENIKIREEKTYFQILNTHISMEIANKRDFIKIGNESLEMEPYNIIYERNNNN